MSGPEKVRRGKKAASAGSSSSGVLDEVDELSKDEKQIARYLRLSCAKKQGNFHSMKVDFFIGQKLVDALMESKWGPQSGKNASPLLINRNACVALMQRLMNKQLFYRAIKIYKESSGDESKEKSGEAEATPGSKKKKKQETPSATPKTDEKGSPDQQHQQQQPKRKFKLEMHEDQIFIDGNEPYVWVYDPTSTKTYIIGSLLILGAIGICLFPLWPSQVREAVYYLSLAGASFLGAILGLAVLKYIVFGIVWAATFGSLHFWLLPNLTEDVGFFESFVPVYKWSYPDTDAAKDTVAAKKKDDDLDAAAASTTSKKLPMEQSTLSGSTVEITSADLNSATAITTGTPTTSVRRRKSSHIKEEEDGFELVDDVNEDAALNK